MIDDIAEETLAGSGGNDRVEVTAHHSMGVGIENLLVIGGGEDGDRFFGGMGRTLRAALWSMFLKQRLAMLVGFVKPEPLQALANILGQPGVTPAVDRTFPLEQVADAMRTLVQEAGSNMDGVPLREVI